MVPGLELRDRTWCSISAAAADRDRGGRLCRPRRRRSSSFPLSEVKRLTGLDVPKDESLDDPDAARLRAAGRRRCRRRLGAVLAAGRRRQGRPRRGGHAHPRRRQHRAAAAWRRTMPVNGKILTTLQIRTRAAKRALAVRGMMEAVTWSFIPAKHAEAVRRRTAGAEARQSDRRRHVGHAAVAAARPDRGRAAQCRQGHRRCRAVRGVGHL